MYKTKVRTIESMENQLAQLCEDIYLLNLKGKRIIPLPPKIIVRVLPKEHKTESGLYLPGNVQNKPMYEGIVLETWTSYDEEIIVKKIQYESEIQEYQKSIHTEFKVIHHECSVKVGDRILFAHFEGQPLPDYLDEKYYRVIKDDVVFGTLNYQGDVELVKKIKPIMEKFSSVTLSGAKSGPGVPDWQPPAKSSMFTS